MQNYIKSNVEKLFILWQKLIIASSKVFNSKEIQERSFVNTLIWIFLLPIENSRVDIHTTHELSKTFMTNRKL